MHNYDCTFYGLHKWHDAMFEKLGWMAMAKNHNNDLKLRAYKEGIQHLLECLQHKHNDTIDQDRKNDLKILIENTKCLQSCTHKLDSNHEHNNNECKSGHAHAHDATFYGLHKWLKHKYEKLGWMCLAKHHHNTLKIQAYLDSINRLRASLEQKLDKLEEKDRKDDIKILLADVCILQKTAHHLLDGTHRHSHRSRRTLIRRSTT
jgi:ABC-type Zn2+ transport system substrate-binding protein/surface adhesin